MWWSYMRGTYAILPPTNQQPASPTEPPGSRVLFPGRPLDPRKAGPTPLARLVVINAQGMAAARTADAKPRMEPQRVARNGKAPVIHDGGLRRVGQVEG